MARSLFSRLSLTRHILPALALVGIVAAIYFIFVQSPDRSMAEATETPARANGEFAGKPRVAGAGIVEPSSETIEVGTALSGLVESVLVAPGDVVTKGDPLFRVDTRNLRSRVAELEAAARRAQAGIAEADAARATAQRQLDLYRAVDDPAAVSRAEVIRAEGDATSAMARRRLAEAELASVRAQLSSARTELDRATVRAPISGEILRVDIRPGELVNAGPGGGGPYMRMGQTNPLHVRIDVDEDEALRVAEGQPAIVSPRGGADERIEARFVRVEPLVVPKKSLTNTASERVDVRVVQFIYALPEDSGLRVGQQVDAFIAAKEAMDQ